MPITLHQIDAFTDRPLAGNPAAVCLLPSFPSEVWMQAVAGEMNLSETAFIVPRAGPDAFDLRWFTPTQEVDLCGHATLAAAHRLFETGRAESRVEFHSLSGVLTVTRAEDGSLTMDFPAEAVTERPRPDGLDTALGAPIEFFGENRMDALVRVADAGWLRALDPDLAWISHQPWRGLIVTAAADEDELDFMSRCFYPATGVPEDPVTGSAHCALGPYWSRRLGRTRLLAYQASARGGHLGVEVAGPRVHLTGRAVTVLEAKLLVDPA